MDAMDHERPDVYRLALDFVAMIYDLTDELPPGSSNLVNQIQRASTSIVLNIAEGAGEFSKKEKARFYRMARRSLTESAAVLDIFRRLGLAKEEALEQARGAAVRIVAMLIRLIQRVSGEGGGMGEGTGKSRG